MESIPADPNDILLFETEHSVKLPLTFKELIVDGPIWFKDLVHFKADVPPGAEFYGEYLSMFFLYGGGSTGDNSLENANAYFRPQVSSHLILIGDGEGGDQICLNKRNGEIIYWVHDEDEDNCELLLAKDFDTFMHTLEILPEEEDYGSEQLEPEFATQSRARTAMTSASRVRLHIGVAAALSILER